MNETIVASSTAESAPPSYRQRIVSEHPQWWLGAMLLALHASLAWGIETLWSRAFLLAHLGLFLMWQPVWRGETELRSSHATLIVVVGALLSVWNNWWFMAIWLAVLFGLIGGNVPGAQRRMQRLVPLLAALYVLSMLLVWVVPHLFKDQELEGALLSMVRFGLLLVPIGVALLKVEPPSGGKPLAVDLFYSVMLFLLVAALVLGSFVIKDVSKSPYPIALAQTLCGIAVLLVVLSWLWTPHSGFVGIGHLLSRYLLSMGLPFERWMQNLANRAEQEQQPDRFLNLALEHMLELPWVAGVKWRSRASAGEFGTISEFRAEFGFQDLTISIFTRWSLSPALLLHLKLLSRLLIHFYEAKRREQLQRQNAYTQAIHETGARLTHDVKNLLQSLKSLCAATESSDAGQAQALQALMQRQLPQIAQRLQTTLDKLKAPAQADSTRIDALNWWNGFKQRYQRGHIVFTDGDIDETRQIPADLFDSVADNLLQNALRKGESDGNLRIDVRLSCAAGVTFSVCDNGSPVAASVAAQLFEGPVPSQAGLGIGLYQAAKQAQQTGYRLTLVSNEAGKVCFELARTSGA